jgi:hypothetical protein
VLVALPFKGTPMQRPRETLLPDEEALLSGREHVVHILNRLDIKQPTNETELLAFNERMDEIFGIFSKNDGYAPIRFLEVCEVFGLNMLAGNGLRAVFITK